MLAQEGATLGREYGQVGGVRLSLHLPPGRPAYDPTEGGGGEVGGEVVRWVVDR